MTETASIHGEAGASPTSLWPLYAANAICAMSMMGFVAVMGPLATVLGLKPWHAGLTVTVGGIVWMFASRPWGRASDRLGRRPVLLISLGGFIFCYILLCGFVVAALGGQFAVPLAIAGLLILRSAIAGFYAAIPVATNALIADTLPKQARAGAMAGVGAAGAVGMVLGPALAAVLARYNLAAPFYVLAALPLPVVVFLFLVLPKDRPVSVAAIAAPKLSDPRLRPALIVAFCGMFTVSVAQITVGFFAIDRIGLAPEAAAQAAGLALTVVGVGLILSQMVVARTSWPPERLIAIGTLVAAAGFLSVALVETKLHLWLTFFAIAVGMGWVFPAFPALAANAVSGEEQGATAGSVGAAQALGLVSGPLVGAALYGLSLPLPYIVSGLMLAALSVVFWLRPPQARAPSLSRA